MADTEHTYHRAIKAGRAYRGQSVADLAEATGFSENQIRHIETDKAKHTIDLILRISEAQDIPLTFYLYGLNYDNPGYLNSDEVITLPQYDLNELVDTAA